jgi:hypothetical protein
MDGKPLAITSDSRGTVVFQPDGGQGTVSTGMLDSAGHFKLSTGSSAQVAPGKYLIAISVVELVPAKEGVESGGKRVTQARYASANNSGLEATVAEGPNEFTFDLSSDQNAGAPPGSAATAVETPAITSATKKDE